MDIRAANGRWEIRFKGTPCATFAPPVLAGRTPDEFNIEPTDEGWSHVVLRWRLEEEVARDELSLPIDLQFVPGFWWAPHLAPEDGYVIAQHVFRAPALIASNEAFTFVVVPDLDRVGQIPGAPWFLDFDARQNRLWIGMSRTDVAEHVLFKKEPGMVLPPGDVDLRFYVTVYSDSDRVPNPWGHVSRFLWDRWGRPLQETGQPLAAPLDLYVRHTYRWAFDAWGPTVWQEFDLNGRRVGAPQFIVNVSQSPNYPGEWYQRENLSIWNQAWFSSLRSASGLYRYARRTSDASLLEKARLTAEFALAAPRTNGLFPSLLYVENDKVEIEGETYARPRGWDEAVWCNSDRCPKGYGISVNDVHILDASWTCLQMLRWYDELEPDPRLLKFSRTYADTLLALQDGEGFFPGWVNPDTQNPGSVMNQTPESAVSASFLLRLAELTGDARYRAAALRGVDALLSEIVPGGRWEDFETYWSCCSWGRDDRLGKRVERNAMYKQNTLSMFWTAEALLSAWHATDDPRYLAWGRRTLDELSMAQQVWQPPFIHVPALGGFGVMNCDGEWNDSRQTLFAELFLDYYRATGDADLFERGVAAMQAGFVMMYCPENPDVKALWEKVYPWFGPEDYGFTMENYGHGGRTGPKGEGMGVFTIYDWGNGAAAETWNRIHDHYGDVYIDRARGNGFGLNAADVRQTEDGWEIRNRTDTPRTINIVFEDGERKTVELHDRFVVSK